MYKGPISIVIKNRKITLFLVVLTAILGLYSYYINPKQDFPDLDSPVAMVTTIYPGASSEDVEKLVTGKVEDKAMEIDGFDYMDSYSYNNLSIVVIRLTTDADNEKAWDELRQKMDDLQEDLPRECREIKVDTDMVETTGIILSVSGKNYSYEELEDYAEMFKADLEDIQGIARMDIVGKQQREAVVEVDLKKLNLYRFSLNDIVNIIKGQNVEIPSGGIDGKNSKINVKASSAFSSTGDIGNTVLDVSENGAVVRLKDVAEVKMELQDSNYKIKHNGENAVLLTAYFKENKNIVLIGDEIENKINYMKKQLPGDLTINKVLFQPGEVRGSINNFALNLLEGILFVIIVVLVGMGLRNAVIVSTAIPISILITFCAMKLFGIEIHKISIAALIVALGMLVDNAIVVSDAIQVRLDSGQDRMGACVGGVKDVAVPILTSTLTTIAAFLPLQMLPGIAGEFISSLPKIVIISLISSYMAALFVTPVMAYIFFRKSKGSQRDSRTRKLFGTLLSLAMKRKAITVSAVVLVVVLAAFLAGKLGLQFFPKADTNVIYIDLKTERSIDISKTEQLTEQATEIVKEQQEVVNYTSAIGNGLPKFYTTIPVLFNSPDVAQVRIELDLEKGSRFRDNSEMAEYLQEMIDSRITGGTATVKQLEIGEPIGYPVRVRLSGDNLRRLGEAADDVGGILRQVDGTINVSDDYSDRIYEYSLDIDSDKVGAYGISNYDVQNEVSIALNGREASVFRRGGREYNIIVKSNILSKEELENLMVKSSYTSNKILLKDIANISLMAQTPSIKKHNGDVSVLVTCDVKPGYSPVDIENQLKSRLPELELRDIEVTFDGEKEKILEHFGNIGTSAVFALLLIFGILLIQFKSFLQPAIVLVTVPLSAVGSVVGLYLSRQPLSFTGLLGIVSLIGIVVNNAIVLIDYINSRRRQGSDVESACMEAADKRLRPIILSAVTTIIGLTPLVFSASDLFRPMAIALMSGLLVSTLLTLIVIPVVFSLLVSKIRPL